MADIFISYAREDKSDIKLLVQLLQAQGWSVWWDTTLRAGETFNDVIGRELEAAKCVIVVWSKNSVGSGWVRDEAAVGHQASKLVPITLDGSLPPLGFRQLHTDDLKPWIRDGKSEEVITTLEAISHLLEVNDERSPEARRRAWQEMANKVRGRFRRWRATVVWLMPSIAAIASLVTAWYIFKPSIYEPIPFDRDARPSFDCADYLKTNKLSAERIPQSDILCHDPTAATADREMGDAFYKLRNALPEDEKTELIRDQKAWLKERNKVCSTSWDELKNMFWLNRSKITEVAECLVRVTNARRDELTSRHEMLSASPAEASPSATSTGNE